MPKSKRSISVSKRKRNLFEMMADDLFQMWWKEHRKRITGTESTFKEAYRAGIASAFHIERFVRQIIGIP